MEELSPVLPARLPEHLWDVALARAGWEGRVQTTVPSGSRSGLKYIFRVSFFCFFLSLRYMAFHHLLRNFHNTLFWMSVPETLIFI